jgi:phosphate transport system substrate-binding protein
MTNQARRIPAAIIGVAILVAGCASSSASPAGSAAGTTPTPVASASDAGSPTPTGPTGTPLTYRCTKADGQLNGAGATFPYPLYSKMGADYFAKCGVKLNYQSIGSGGGVKQWTANTVDFGASDAFLSDAEIAAAAGNGEAVEIPVTFGAVVVAYNLNGLTAPLKMTPDVIAGIFDGRITVWNDSAIAAVNPGVSLPDLDVTVVHRSDGSGTTSIFTTYLTLASPEWVDKVGAGDPKKSAGKTVEWPTGLGASGNEGVTQGISQTEGAVGYIELAYALQNNIPFADVQNKNGNWIRPSLESLKTAAELPSYPADLRFNLANTDSPQGYPITGSSWLIVYKDLSRVMQSKDRANALVDFLWWAIHDGQADAAPLHYGSIPASLLVQNEAAIRSINWAGEPLLP